MADSALIYHVRDFEFDPRNKIFTLLLSEKTDNLSKVSLSTEISLEKSTVWNRY